MQGWRITMEDAHTAVLDLHQAAKEEWRSEDDEAGGGRIPKGLSFFGVFDGHGGSEVAEYTGKNMVRLISENLANSICTYEAMLPSVFLETDKRILAG